MTWIEEDLVYLDSPDAKITACKFFYTLTKCIRNSSPSDELLAQVSDYQKNRIDLNLTVGDHWINAFIWDPEHSHLNMEPSEYRLTASLLVSILDQDFSEIVEIKYQQLEPSVMFIKVVLADIEMETDQVSFIFEYKNRILKFLACIMEVKNSAGSGSWHDSAREAFERFQNSQIEKNQGYLSDSDEDYWTLYSRAGEEDAAGEEQQADKPLQQEISWQNKPIGLQIFDKMTKLYGLAKDDGLSKQDFEAIFKHVVGDR